LAISSKAAGSLTETTTRAPARGCVPPRTAATPSHHHVVAGDQGGAGGMAEVPSQRARPRQGHWPVGCMLARTATARADRHHVVAVDQRGADGMAEMRHRNAPDHGKDTGP